MSSSPSFGDALKGRLMLAILAGAAASSEACRKGANPVQPDPIASADATATDTATSPVTATPSANTSTSTNAGAVTPPADAPKPAAQATCPKGKPSEQCYAPYTNARSTGTGEPAPPPPQSAYDKDGCLPKSLVTNGCCNRAVAGPRVAAGQCCYAFCPGPCCGRPFLVGGVPRLAALAGRDDWLARDVELDARDGDLLDTITRTHLRDAWLADARMEHASAAAFGRFVLQLLSLGAPPSLVRDAALAAADEVRHAQMCFSLAARFGGDAHGPMPLSLDGALDARSLEDIIADVIAEGCVGETIAAVVASRQLDGAQNDAVRRVLEQIQADEAKHAELAWSFVRWAIDVHGEPVRECAARAFACALDRTEKNAACEDVTEHRAAWKACGRLTASEAEDARTSALSEIVEPCARELLGQRIDSMRTRFRYVPAACPTVS